MAAAETVLPRQIDLAPLLADTALRADMLFFIRTGGVYCRNIFWQIFNRHNRPARARRQILLTAARELIQNDLNSKNFCPKCRHQPCICPKIGGNSSLWVNFTSLAKYNILSMRQADILDAGFIRLMRQLAGKANITEIFSAALRQRHGLQWDFNQFIDAVEALQKMRGFLEHYDERIAKAAKAAKTGKSKKVQIPSNWDYAQFFTALGRLLLPQLSNELLQSARKAKDKCAVRISADMEILLDAAKTWRAESIRKMFAEARPGRIEGARQQQGKKAPPRQTPKAQRKAFLEDEWFKVYQRLEVAKTGLRPYKFKFYYDFIGKKNFAELFKLFSGEIFSLNGSVVDTELKNMPNFTYDIVPFYITVLRIMKIMHIACEELKNKKGNLPTAELKAIRDEIAHNGLFWLVKEGENILSAEQIFAAVINALPKGKAAAFCDQIEALLRRGNYPVAHSEADGAPKTEKLRRFNARVKAELAREGAAVDKRRKVRKALAQWMRALQKAGSESKHHLQKAGKNAN